MLPAFFMFTTNGIPALQEQKAGDVHDERYTNAPAQKAGDAPTERLTGIAVLAWPTRGQPNRSAAVLTP
jgi:hypothetical protein